MVQKHIRKTSVKASAKDDVEMQVTSRETSRVSSLGAVPESTSHYGIAKQMLHYQSVDVGPLCEW